MRCAKISAYHEFAFPVAAAAMLVAGLLATAVKAQQPAGRIAPDEADVARAAASSLQVKLSMAIIF
jgi:hypothetical protein